VRTFVILDDQDPPLNFARRILTQNGYQVVGIARTGQQAVDLCREKRPDVALLDYSMSGMTGEEAATIIAAEGLARVVCMATSINMAGKVAYWRSLGYYNVTKPYRDRQMLNQLHEIEEQLNGGSS
jgi:CheY-like chemotaxis protein